MTTNLLQVLSDQVLSEQILRRFEWHRGTFSFEELTTGTRRAGVGAIEGAASRAGREHLQGSRGVRTLHDSFPIQEIWDSGYPGTSTDSSEYEAYMRLRRSVGARVIEKHNRKDFGRTRFRYLSAKDSRLPSNANEQGIVMKIEQLTPDKATIEGSTVLTGDGGAATWKNGIMKDYSTSNVSCNILLAAHHGSISFFDDPDDDNYYYTSHIKAMKPDMVIVSVGENSYGHPDKKALELYEKYSSGSERGDKLFRTDQQGTMKLILKAGGGCSLQKNQ